MPGGTRLPSHLGLHEGGGLGRSQGGRGLAGHLGLSVLALCSATVLLFSVGGWSVATYSDRNVTRLGLDLGGDDKSAKHDVANYLLVGNDSRAGTNGEYGDEPGQHSDTTILMHVAADGATTMISFPRDTLVDIPAYTDNAGKKHRQHKGKFNSALHDGGPQLLVNMIQSLTGMQVDHYVAVDLAGFKKITDAIGGVDVCVKPSDFVDRFKDDNGRWRTSTNTKDSMSGWVGGPGTVHVNGDQALAFVRQRHGFRDGDIARIQRQQQFLGAVFHKAMSGDVLTNPLKSSALLRAATGAVTLDDDTSLDELLDLALSMKGMVGGMNVTTLPTRSPGLADGGNPEDGTLPPYGSVQLYDPVDLAKIVVPLGGHVEDVDLDGTAAPGAAGTPDPGATPGPVTVPADQVTVSVYNGSTTSGLAAKATTALTGQGFHATSAGNADSKKYTAPRVLYGPGRQEAAWTVQAAVPGSITRADPTITGIHLILGSEYTGVVTPTVTGTTTGTAPATATAPAPAPAPESPAAQGQAPPTCTL
ncbi:transcriptional regulator [Frankia sp. CcI49]|uniref:LCP family protein n=1 Tax=Frankia sp. CcI49 TaxID=1745382 RepID=UPI00097609A3|nr:LCP family protein [Frankia sp. CcI49]ONH58186.1 transcriptional regulator [Frankia sp. CcI49]